MGSKSAGEKVKKEGGPTQQGKPPSIFQTKSERSNIMEKNAIQQYLDSQQEKIRLEKAQKRFGFKPFTERFKPFFITAHVLRWLLPPLVGPLSVVFLYDHIQEGIEIMFISVVLSSVLGAAWEYGKAKGIEIASELLYSMQFGQGLAMAIVALGMQAGSTYAAVEGAKIAYSMRDDRVIILKGAIKSERDSVDRYWLAKADSAKALAEKYKNDNVIDIITETGTKKTVLRSGAPGRRYEKLIEAVQVIEADKREALKKFDAEADTKKDTAVQESGKATKNVMWFTLIMEAFILIANWFLVHYDYESFKLSYLLTREEDKLHDYKTFAQVYHMYRTSPMLLQSGTIQLNHTAKNQIGFHAGKNAQPPSNHATSHAQAQGSSLNQALDGLTLQEISRKIQELQAHAQALGQGQVASQVQGLGAVDRAIQAGLLEELRSMKALGQKMAYQDITQRYGISIPQIQAIKKLYNI